MFSGSAARYPEIRWILSHGGGSLPFVVRRFIANAAGMEQRDPVLFRQRLPNGLMYELKKFYYDTTAVALPGPLSALLKLVPPSQILCGSDYPYRRTAEVIEGLAALHLPAKDLRAIERDNALRLMPGLNT